MLLNKSNHTLQFLMNVLSLKHGKSTKVSSI